MTSRGWRELRKDCARARACWSTDGCFSRKTKAIFYTKMCVIRIDYFASLSVQQV